MKIKKGVSGFPLALIIFLTYKFGYSKGRMQGYKDRLYEEVERQYYDNKYSENEK